MATFAYEPSADRRSRFRPLPAGNSVMLFFAAFAILWAVMRACHQSITITVLAEGYNGYVRVRTIGGQALQIPSLASRRFRNAVFRRLCHSLGGDESLPPVNHHGRSHDVAVICSAG